MSDKKTKILRGRLLTFNDAPKGADDWDSYSYEEDGALLISNGKIEERGPYSVVASNAPTGTEIIDHRPHLIVPGFIDTHIHFPQAQVIASWADQLLDWLNDYTFPAELKFADKTHGKRIAKEFFDALLSHGTTTAVAYCSSHPNSVDAYFEEAEARDMLMIGGKTMMDRNAPADLCDTAQNSYDDSKKLLEKWHGRGRAHYAVTPRFAITSTPAQLEAAGSLLNEHPGVHLQTHINENHNEISLTKELFPEAADYLGVYEGFGLLGPRSLLGHCIHMNERELGVMRETGSVAVFCPTSNLFLGSGLFDKARLEASGIRTAIATDVGGGTNYSMLRTLDEGYKVLQLQRQRLHPLTCFYWATLGNAKALSLSDWIGTLDAGTDADVVVLDARATRPMALRMETVETLSEELFVLQTLGDDRAIVETYVAGSAAKQSGPE
ncbi:MAG: guanine deaminase [Roseibium sp.]|uniref:guanine deaminase n=1 Tax=Roseibium sp. TaxID=1936156 RepID=UPI001AFF11C0|nr:guanine deaminase [Roseibium sp.]MBO6891361.1 guanine deaminase [Roseibium sp.]MBO6929091.1 guanine deaminase [Roseibium sp.]